MSHTATTSRRSVTTLLALGAALYLGHEGRAGERDPGEAIAEAELVGAGVYDSGGEPIGRVKAVEGDRLIVSIGAELGIGTRDITLGRDQVVRSGAPGERRFITTLSPEELEALPERH